MSNHGDQVNYVREKQWGIRETELNHLIGYRPQFRRDVLKVCYQTALCQLGCYLRLKWVANAVRLDF